MTQDRDSKREVRARMRVTGERYTQARNALYGPSVGTPPVRSTPDAKGVVMVNEQLLASLDRDGYAVVRNVVPSPVIRDLRQWVEGLVDDDLAWRMREVQRRRDAGEADVRAFPRGSEGRFHLTLDDEVRHAQLVDGVADIARSIGTPLSGSGGIVVGLPGWGAHDGLHPDLNGPAPDIGKWDGAIATWPLSPWEGMRVVPGSHRRDPIFREAFAGAIAPHPDEVYIEAEPGDVVINSIHIWKSGTLNRSSERRSEIWIGFKSDESVSGKIAAYWAGAEISDGGAPWDPGNFVQRHDVTH
jgi:hypothetical protein